MTDDLVSACRELLELLEATYERNGKSVNPALHDIAPYFDLEWPSECEPATYEALKRIAGIVLGEEPCHHPYWKQLKDGSEVCQRCGADVSHMDGMGG